MPKAKGAQVPAKPRKLKANGYKFPDRLPAGEILKDVLMKEWILGESIGQGGFGEIYCASEAKSGNTAGWPFVIKIEPHENGPLFMEKNFYIKVGKPDDVNAWKQKEGIKILGMPTFHGSGTHMHNNTKYRFLVIDRYGKDLWSLFLKAKTFPPHTVFKCALQIIDTLRYIHSKNYVHGDIKGANLLLGLKSGTENNVFLVDFGLACKYSQKEFKKDPKQAHNGTIEYTSCDWHLGIPTRRGDLEILGYNLLHWLTGSLPWEKDIANKETVHKKKQELMSSPETYMKKHFPNVSQAMVSYMAYVSKLKHDEEPNYKFCKELFVKELKRIGSSVAGTLDFTASKANSAAQRGPRRSTRTSTPLDTPASQSDDENELPMVKKKPGRKPRVVKPESIDNGISQDDCSGTDDQETSKQPAKRSAKTDPKTTKKTKTAPSVKPSWRDAPTVQGNVNNKAGEYVKKAKK